jgi:hypothetical protein
MANHAAAPRVSPTTNPAVAISATTQNSSDWLSASRIAPEADRSPHEISNPAAPWT